MDIAAHIKKRILLLDGAMGTMLQRHHLTETDFRGQQFRDHAYNLQGNHDLLSLTQPDLIAEIHREYLLAGADIIETNTFNANSISLQDYQLQDMAYELNIASVRLAKKQAQILSSKEKPRFVAGVIGPTNRTATMSPKVEDPGFRNITFVQLVESYQICVHGLLQGGADLLLIETVFDTLNCKAALFAIQQYFEAHNITVPVMISGTIVDQSGRTLSGQTVAAFYHAVKHIKPLSIGLNCALGAKEMQPYLQELATIADCAVSAHPNAGLPNALGGYDETPESMAKTIAEFADQGLLNIIGGCCGTTPAHIKAISEVIARYQPREIKTKQIACYLAGLESLKIDKESLFINIGERTNVAGSKRFLRLINEGNYTQAVEIAREQIENGAQIIDINMDDALIDGQKTMVTFLNLIAAEPDIAKVPIMIDSSKWQVLEAGMQCVQGKGVVNSLSLKEGETVFIELARKVKQYGFAVIIMAFDEKGQADTLAKRVAICQRAYQLLTEKVAFPAEDIIFDPNVFAIGTGIKDHNNYAVDFIQATKQIKENLPHALISGGISNVSFSFRGNDRIREAIHAVFLFHAIEAGLDMGIVNAGQLAVYSQLDQSLLACVEDLVRNRRDDATERLLALADKLQTSDKTNRKKKAAWREFVLDQRIQYAMVQGIDQYIVEDTKLLLADIKDPLAVIEGPLMAGMSEVGDLFGAGKMFLPQVVKSARVMKKAVAYLEPFFDKNAKMQHKGVVIMATVKGDVHDIGKNIVSIVLQCNNYHVIDLGVMVPGHEILAAAKEHQADLIGLSGLITPSLDEMVQIAKIMQIEGFNIPLLIGGATTSKMHTALKISPCYQDTIYVKDASRVVNVAASLLNQLSKDNFLDDIKKDYFRLQTNYQQGHRASPRHSLADARANGLKTDWHRYQNPTAKQYGIHVFNDYNLEELVATIDWTPFFKAWNLHGKYPLILDDKLVGQEARRLLVDAKNMLAKSIKEKWLTAKAVFGLFKANAIGDDVALYQHNKEIARFCFLRQQMVKKSAKANLCLADFVAPKDSNQLDTLGLFAVNVGDGVDSICACFDDEGDHYNSILLKSLADRLAESLAERLHQRVRQDFWGYASTEDLDNDALIKEQYQGIRPAPGYPACPDHSEKKLLFRLLDAENNIGLSLTENFAMWPAAAVSGFYFAHEKAQYFGIGRINDDQLVDYAKRKKISLNETRRLLSPIIAE